MNLLLAATNMTICRSITQIINEKGIFDEIYKKIGHNPKWKKFEKMWHLIIKLKQLNHMIPLLENILSTKSRSDNNHKSIDKTEIFSNKKLFIKYNNYGNSRKQI